MAIQTTGLLMIAAPFVVLFIVCGRLTGWWKTVGTFATVFAIIVWLYFGVWLWLYFGVWLIKGGAL